eukprot:scaffold732_cov85-Isochrysis_galbana.AAC.3
MPRWSVTFRSAGCTTISTAAGRVAPPSPPPHPTSPPPCAPPPPPVCSRYFACAAASAPAMPSSHPLRGSLSPGLSMAPAMAGDQPRSLWASEEHMGAVVQRGSRWACMSDSLREREPNEAEIVLSSTWSERGGGMKRDPKKEWVGWAGGGSRSPCAGSGVETVGDCWERDERAWLRKREWVCCGAGPGRGAGRRRACAGGSCSPTGRCPAATPGTRPWRARLQTAPAADW